MSHHPDMFVLIALSVSALQVSWKRALDGSDRVIAVQEKAIFCYAKQVAELQRSEELVRGQRGLLFQKLQNDSSCPKGYTFSQFETAIKHAAKALNDAEGLEVVESKQVLDYQWDPSRRMKSVTVTVAVGGEELRDEKDVIREAMIELPDRRGGRPKVVPEETAEAKERRKRECLDWCADQTANNKKGRTVPQIIKEGKEKFGMGADEHVDPSTISRRVSSGNLAVTKRGPKGPTEGAFESLLVSYSLAFASLGFPQTISQVTAFANSCLAGTSLGAEILATKKRESNLSGDGSILGATWAHNFLTRRGHELENKMPVTLESNRHEWGLYDNFVRMYDNFEIIVLKNKIAVSH